jgi:UDP-N-acetylglucosamine 2-epimerase (non-hydrolysing)
MKTAIIVGTRPEIIKMSPVIREYKRRGLDFFVLHTGQHYSYEMDKTFFEDLELDDPEYNLNVGSSSHATQTGKIMAGVEEVIKDICNLVLVQGDTNTVLGGALAAVKMHIPVGHVESGLRSWDRKMPEEINRVVADHVSEYLFAPTSFSQDNLLKEGIPASKIWVTGNTVVDAVNQNIEIAKKKRSPLDPLGLDGKRFFLATAHRAENTDDQVRFRGIIEGLQTLAIQYGMPVVYPMHPRAAKMVEKFGIDIDGICVIPPVGYLDFLILESEARLILTDSGGVQEEACILGTPCVTLRDNTERPETLIVGSNVLSGAVAKNILDKASEMLQRNIAWDNPFGDGRAGDKIVDIVLKNV